MEDIWASVQKTIQPAFDKMLVFAIEFIIAVIIFLIGWQITQYVQKIARRALYRRDSKTDPRLYAAAHRLILIAGIGLSVAAALLVMGLNIETLMTSMGLAFVGIAFALKDTLENSISGLYLLFERTIKENDVVVVSGIEGNVEEVSVRTTNIRTYDGLHILVPNKMFFQNPFTNKTHYPTRRYDLGVNISYTSDLRQTHALLLETVKGITGVLVDPAPSVTLDKFEPLFVHATIRYWLNWQTTDNFVVLTAMSQAVVEAAQRAGVELFLPPQQLADVFKPA
jgi:small-conductance mechanosensitive channel